MKLGLLLYVRCRHCGRMKGFRLLVFQLTKNADSYGIVPWIVTDGCNECVHRKKQHASSIRMIPSKNIAFIQVFFFESSNSMQYRSMLVYSRLHRTHSRKFWIQITLAPFLKSRLYMCSMKTFKNKLNTSQHENYCWTLSCRIHRYLFCYLSALYPVHWTAQSALHFPPLADLFILTPFSASLGSILAMQQLRNDYSLTFPPLSIARYSIIQLSRLRRREVKENAQTSKRYQRGFEPGLSRLRVRHSTTEPLQ